MIYSLILIAIITLIFGFLYRAKVIRVCPICAGTVITWTVGLVGLYRKQPWADPALVAILLGASLGALAEKYGSRYGLLWKSLTVLLGFPAIYLLVQQSLFPGLGLIILLAGITVFVHRKNTSGQKEKKDLFKDCC